MLPDDRLWETDSGECYLMTECGRQTAVKVT